MGKVRRLHRRDGTQPPIEPPSEPQSIDQLSRFAELGEAYRKVWNHEYRADA